MSDQNKLAILSVISSDLTPGKPARFSFNSLTKTLNLSKEDLDTLLLELNKNRFISQYVKKGVDGFTIVLNSERTRCSSGWIFHLRFDLVGNYTQTYTSY